MAKRKKKDAACELVAYRFYGVPSELDAVQEDKTFGCCRYLWNQMLGDHNTPYAEIGHVLNNTPADYKDLDECFFLNEVDSLALANTALNLDAAFKRFFKKTGGYPRVKYFVRCRGITTPGYSHIVRNAKKSLTRQKSRSGAGENIKLWSRAAKHCLSSYEL